MLHVAKIQSTGQALTCNVHSSRVRICTTLTGLANFHQSE